MKPAPEYYVGLAQVLYGTMPTHVAEGLVDLFQKAQNEALEEAAEAVMPKHLADKLETCYGDLLNATHKIRALKNKNAGV